MEIRKVQKDGNSLVIPIPPSFLNTAGLKLKDNAAITLTVDKKILISKLITQTNGGQQ